MSKRRVNAKAAAQNYEIERALKTARSAMHIASSIIDAYHRGDDNVAYQFDVINDAFNNIEELLAVGQ